MEFLFTRHARERMYERKISVEEVKATVNRGMKWFAKSDGRWHAKMGAVEAVFEREENNIIIVTVY